MLSYISWYYFFFFFFNDTATPEIYTLSLHDALPICIAICTLAVLGEDTVRGGPAEMRLEDLADVHPARHTERVEHDVRGTAILEERHVLFRDDLRDHALVAVPAGELVALGDLALLGHVDAHELVDAGRQVVARATRERLDVDDDAALAVGDLQRGVADL